VRSAAELHAGMEDYGAVVYGRGALMYLALRQHFGDARYLAWVRAWQEAHRYGVATEADWRAHLAELLGADGAQAFADRWLSGHGMTRGVIMAEVLRGGMSATASATSGETATPAASASGALPAP
jgi:hypothetical protein